MATFNGAAYLLPQLHSILAQLAPNDELVVVDDASSDDTLRLLQGLGDPRLRLLQNARNQGPTAAFERAVCAASGRYIFLSDQDDTWHPQKIERILAVFDQKNADLVVHDAEIRTQDGQVIPSVFALRRFVVRPRGRWSGLWVNVLNSSFTGCCMAFRRALLDDALPFPGRGLGRVWHDQWIGLAALLGGRAIVYLPEPLVTMRRHAHNLTAIRPRYHKPLAMLGERLSLLAHLLLRPLRPRPTAGGHRPPR
jgi:glycosyltransferase involved in cell wall biosynthesis